MQYIFIILQIYLKVKLETFCFLFCVSIIFELEIFHNHDPPYLIKTTSKYCKFKNFCENFISQIVLKDIFAMLKICGWGMIYIYQ